MDLTGVTYGQRVHQDGREVTRKECFDACAQAEHCAQAVCYDAGRSVWKDDSPCTCYPMNTASYLDQPDDGSCEGGSDCEGGSNTGFASIHCKSTPIVCTRPDDPGYAIESEALEVPNFAVAFTGGACAAGYEGTPKADPCSASGPYTLSGCTADPVKVWAHGVISNVWYTAGDRMDPLASIFEPALTGAVKLESSDALIQSLHGLGGRRRVNATSRASYLRAGGYQSGS